MKIIGQLKAILGLDKTRFDRGLNDAEKKTSKFSSGMEKLAGKIIAAFSVVAIINFGKQLIGLASKAEGVKAAFKSLNKPTLLDDLRKATRGTVDDVMLMQKAVQARNFKIPLEQLATYFEFATKRAIQTGESVDYLVDSIITGIGRKSVLVMDNLGISAVELQEETKKIGDFGIAAGNIIRRELESMGDVADTTATKIVGIQTAFVNLKTTLGEKLVGSEYFQDFIEGIKTVTGWLKGKPSEYEGFSRESLLYAKENLEQKRDSLRLSNWELKTKKDELSIWNKIWRFQTEIKTEIKNSEKELNKTINDLEEINGLLSVIKSNVVTPVVTPVEKISRVKTLTEVKAPALTGITGLPTAGLAGMPASITQQAEDLTAALQAQQVAVNILSNAFNTLFTSTEDGFKNMIDSILIDFKRLIAELLAQAAVLMLLRVVLPGSDIAVGATTQLMKMFGTKAFGFASGGTVPSGYPHDTFPAMLSSGETVLTAQQSRDFNRKLNIHVTGEISGSAIALVGRRTEVEN